MLSRSVLRRFSQCAAMTSKTVMPRQITLQSNKTLSCTQKRFISLSFKLNSDGSEQTPTIETRLEGILITLKLNILLYVKKLVKLPIVKVCHEKLKTGKNKLCSKTLQIFLFSEA